MRIRKILSGTRTGCYDEHSNYSPSPYCEVNLILNVWIFYSLPFQVTREGYNQRNKLLTIFDDCKVVSIKRQFSVIATLERRTRMVSLCSGSFFIGKLVDVFGDFVRLC